MQFASVSLQSQKFYEQKNLFIYKYVTIGRVKHKWGIFVYSNETGQRTQDSHEAVVVVHGQFVNAKRYEMKFLDHLIDANAEKRIVYLDRETNQTNNVKEEVKRNGKCGMAVAWMWLL